MNDPDAAVPPLIRIADCATSVRGTVVNQIYCDLPIRLIENAFDAAGKIFRFVVDRHDHRNSWFHHSIHTSSR